MEILLVFEPGLLVAKLLASYSNVSHYCVQNPPYHCRIWKRKTTGQPDLLYAFPSPRPQTQLSSSKYKNSVRIFSSYKLFLTSFQGTSCPHKLFLLIFDFEDSLDSLNVKIRKFGLTIECEIKYIKNPMLYI